ncbi:protein ACCELERATED CELL DEATH 6-like [Gossypium australe]|uniref:Protein ACCELERATED CELL DEATH 6-like n=1 Tax=Gossypium australe TaxID=47621 RepID=A0A5B6WK10_9ROSI|nr:protein ACCELERATED CELL DEATH 6-like [Gossypium australe]
MKVSGSYLLLHRSPALNDSWSHPKMAFSDSSFKRKRTQPLIFSLFFRSPSENPKGFQGTYEQRRTPVVANERERDERGEGGRRGGGGQGSETANPRCGAPRAVILSCSVFSLDIKTPTIGNHDGLLDIFLKTCLDRIRDFTTANCAALHIATKNNSLDVLQVLTRTLRRKDNCWEVVNRKDNNGSIALHIAAENNQPEHATNQHSLTAVDAAQNHNSRESITALRGCFTPRVSNFNHKLENNKKICLSSTAARIGNVSDLYSLIQRDGNVLRHFDEVEFVETPLHIAAEEGCIRFAIELLNLKPSFARKPNQRGLSPIHLALKKGHK